MNDFFVHIPTKLYFGSSQKENFITEVRSLGKNVLMVTGGGSIKKHGFYDPMVSALRETGIELFEFSGIEPNPLSSTINKCAEMFFTKSIDSVIAFGGGSVMDAAKGIASLLYIKKMQDEGSFKELPLDIWHYVLGSDGVGSIPGSLPVIAIPTTAATASEVTPYAVISNIQTQGKAPIAYEFIKPKVSYFDPEYTTRLPEHTTQDGAADILSHVFENYLLGGSDAPLTDRYCESVILTVIETLPMVLEDPFNTKYRGTLLWASSLALNGFHIAGRESGPFILHAIEHSMSAVNHDLAHGRGLATLYPAYFRWLWNRGRAQDRLSRLGKNIFNLQDSSGLSGLHFIEQFEMWLSKCGLLQSAKDLGFTNEDYEKIADYTIRTYGDGNSIEVLGEMTHSDIVEILTMTESQGSLKIH
jgi:alcohol dehydrogenase YqhD (iron-dependent ADH family)